ncbi:MAG: response regulator [FCB group bacterium]|nr:response regulator [FCB group bacterium]
MKKSTRSGKIDKSSRNILVVDDQQSTLKIMEIGLKDKGFNVFLAKNGETALRLAEKNEIHFALLDIRLPDHDGISLSKELKSMYPAVINILMTGYPGLESAIEALRNNVYDYLIKPFRIGQVLSVLQRAEREFQLLGKHINNMQLIKKLQQENAKLKETLDKVMPDERQLVMKYGKEYPRSLVQKVYSKQISKDSTLG